MVINYLKGQNMSNGRTYVPTLYKFCKLIQRFVTSHKTKLEASLGATGYALLVAVLDAVELLLTFLETDTYPASESLVLQD